MKTQIFTCDLCKQSKSENDLCHLTVGTRGITISPNKYHSDINIDICKDCLEKKGFVIKPEDKMIEAEINKNKKTLEDKIVDILQDLDVAFHE